MSQLILVLEENPEIQSLIAASLKASAISVTKSFGTSLSEVAGIGRSLLDFQTSIKR